MDKVDKILLQWNKERPDLDVGPMGVIGRVKRLYQSLTSEMDKTFSAHGLNHAKFDVLATLRRSGAPYRLSPNDLLALTMVTSGTMTNRIDQLVKAGLVERIPNPDDGRSFLIALTNKGFTVIDKAVDDHVKTQARLTTGLSLEEIEAFNDLLKKFLKTLESSAADPD
ncbi:MAG: MarR family transcriptional regulator [Desulfuromusa sp.]|jgi:DNA-binding MarR family transcriptional regulator|nr:MarR family transcriptional regulator [Desulfuromusa sp.]